jgi:hypothetical protein
MMMAKQYGRGIDMGLDMYLHAKKFNTTFCRNSENEYKPVERPKIDGFDISEYTLDVLYWRKNHWLHGHIVEHFAAGVDNCEPIQFRPEDLLWLADQLDEWAKDASVMEPTDGFYFGSQDDDWRDECRERAPEDAKTIRKVVEWMQSDTGDSWRDVEYQASW